MDILNLSTLIANPEINEAVVRARRLLQSVLPEADFSHREQFALMLTNEVVRSLLEEELQSLADEFGERVAVQGARNRLPEARARNGQVPQPVRDLERDAVDVSASADRISPQLDHPYDVARAARSKTVLSHR
jgi:hypothetical protein